MSQLWRGLVSTRYCSDTTRGFAALVVSKHLMAALLAWVVPLIFAQAETDLDGLLYVQIMTLGPHALALVSGLILASPGCGGPAAQKSMRREYSAKQLLLPTPKSTPMEASGGGAPRTSSYDPPVLPLANPPSPSSHSLKWSPLAAASATAASASVTAASTTALRRRVLLIGVWRALVVSSLHTFHSIKVALLVSRGLSLTDAGSRVAANDVISAALLPILVFPVQRSGLRPLLIAAPIVSAAATMTLASTASADSIAGDGQVSVPTAAATFTLSLMEIGAPVVPLAMLPANSQLHLGSSYAIVEMLLVLFQIGSTLLFGVLRVADDGGFEGALWLFGAGFGLALAVSIPLVGIAEEPPSRR